MAGVRGAKTDASNPFIVTIPNPSACIPDRGMNVGRWRARRVIESFKRRQPIE
jgi:hypothetical protein